MPGHSLVELLCPIDDSSNRYTGTIFTVWPAAGDDYDKLTMTCIDKHHSAKKAKIQLTLFPQLNERVNDQSEDDDFRDRVLVKAHVVLQ